MVIDDMLSGGHARTLLAIEDKDEQYNMGILVFDNKMSVRETEKLVRDYLKKKEIKKEKEIQEEARTEFARRDKEQKRKRDKRRLFADANNISST